ncbi:MAG: hypothetical protein ABJE47_01970 [bacterium]
MTLNVSPDERMVPHAVTLTNDRRPLTIVAACFDGLAERSLLANAAIPGVSVVMVDERVGLMQRLAGLRPRMVIFPAMDAHRDDCAPLVERVLRDAREILPVVLVRQGSDARGIAEAVRAGAMLCTWTSEQDIADALLQLTGTPRATRADRPALTALAGDLRPAACVEVLLVCAEQSHLRLSVVDLATLLGRSRRSLNRWMHLAHWPPPSELIEWGRLLRASTIQWRDEESLSTLATAAGYRNVVALQRSAHKLLGTDAAVNVSLTPLQVGTALRRRITSLSRDSER